MASPSGAEEERHDVQLDLISMISLSDLVVGYDGLERVDDTTATNGAGEQVTFPTYQLVVDKVLRDAGDLLSPDDDLTVTIQPGDRLDVITALPLSPDVQLDGATGVLGLSRLSDLYTSRIPQDFAVSFFGRLNGADSLEFNDAEAGPRLTDEFSQVASALSVGDPIDVIRQIQLAVVESNSGSSSGTQQIDLVRDAVQMANHEDQAGWRDLPPEDRPATLETVPRSVLDDAVAFGIAIVFAAGPSTVQSNSVLEVRTPLGITHSFVPGVGDHLTIGLAGPAGSADLYATTFSADGEQVGTELLAGLGVVQGGRVVHVTLTEDDKGTVRVTGVEWREPTDDQLEMARGMGIDPENGALTPALLDSLPDQT